jgi:hypothetical protein
MTQSLTLFKILTQLANELEGKNVKYISPKGLRSIAKLSLKKYTNVD